jgi:hypothetical protein
MMRLHRGHGGYVLLAICLGILVVPWPARGQAGETAGMITEIKIGRGRVEVKPAGATEWRQVMPLLALRAGDTLRATEDAAAVVLLSGGRGTIRVEAGRSPFVVPGLPAGEGKLQKAIALLEASLNFLTSGARELPQAVLATRAGAKLPVILSPRNGPVLPDSLTYEWLGSRFARYTIKIVGPAGMVLERTGVMGSRFDYPPDAPALRPGARYRFEVLAGGHPPQEAWFELLDPTRTQAIRRDLEALEQALSPLVSPNTLVALRVGFLASEGLLHDARLLLLAALTRDPEEPTLYHLLGNLYATTGLPELAVEAYAEAQFLATRGMTEPPPVQR